MQKPPLQVKIDLGQGIFSRIVVNQDSDPIETAVSFCQEKGFPQEVCQLLAVKIKQNMEAYFGPKNEVVISDLRQDDAR